MVEKNVRGFEKTAIGETVRSSGRFCEGGGRVRSVGIGNGTARRMNEADIFITRSKKEDAARRKRKGRFCENAVKNAFLRQKSIHICGICIYLYRDHKKTVDMTEKY